MAHKVTIKDITMADLSIKKALPKYHTNPSLENMSVSTRNKKSFFNNGAKHLVIDEGTGEQVGHMGAIFIEEKTVDTEQFIKLFAAGVEQLADLSAAGYRMFKLVYSLMLENPNTDKILIEYNDLVYSKKWEQSQRTFQRGIAELLIKEIIFLSVSPNLYFINVRLFYNGDRISILKSYKLTKNAVLIQPSLLDDHA
jgi:hypothetical protein